MAFGTNFDSPEDATCSTTCGGVDGYISPQEELDNFEDVSQSFEALSLTPKNAEDQLFNENLDRKVIFFVLSLLNQLVCDNCRKGCRSTFFSDFHSIAIPAIPLEVYVIRLHKLFRCPNEIYVMALIYVDRLVTKNQRFVASQFCVHRVFFVSLVLAVKFFEDAYFSNGYYARAGGIQVSELNRLENDFLFMIGFNMYVSEDEFTQYRDKMVSMVFHPKKTVRIDTSSKVEEEIINEFLCSEQEAIRLNMLQRKKKNFPEKKVSVLSVVEGEHEKSTESCILNL